LKYALIVLHGPDIPASQQRTEGLAAALCAAGHTLQRVFFYGEGTRIGLPEASAAQHTWATLADTGKTELAVCSASAERHGIHQSPAPFVFAGLGALMEAGFECDRIITCV
jgi:tRNA 2-thiouridine synthesizing protein D